MERTLTCICCPLGCSITLTVDGESVSNIAGNACKRGADYAKSEAVNPTRIVTAVLPVSDSREPLSVKTQSPIPKALIFPCLNAINAARATLPIAIGDVVVRDVCGTGVDVVATKNLGM